MKISVVINTKNEERNIERCLRSVLWADEIVVMDMNSTDSTVEIASKFGAKIRTCPDFGYVEPARNLAISEATGDWIFILDADEVIPENLAANVHALIEQAGGHYSLIAIPRRNYIGDYLIRNSGWGGDYQPRLFKRGKVRWSDAIHSWPQVEGEIKHLDPQDGFYIKHYNFVDLSDLVDKINRYTTFEADLMIDKQFEWQDIVRTLVEEFNLRYTPEEDGVYSFMLAGSLAFYKFLSYCKVLERRKDLRFEVPDNLEKIFKEGLNGLEK